MHSSHTFGNMYSPHLMTLPCAIAALSLLALQWIGFCSHYFIILLPAGATSESTAAFFSRKHTNTKHVHGGARIRSLQHMRADGSSARFRSCAACRTTNRWSLHTYHCPQSWVGHHACRGVFRKQQCTPRGRPHPKRCPLFQCPTGARTPATLPSSVGVPHRPTALWPGRRAPLTARPAPCRAPPCPRGRPHGTGT